MADTKISAETAAAALDGTELFVGVQGGANVKVTADQIRTRAQTGAALLSSNNIFTATSQTVSGVVPAVHLNTTAGGDSHVYFDNGGTNFADVNGNSSNGLYYFVNSGMSHHFYVAGADTLDITGSGLNLITGKVLSVAGVTILDGSGVLQAAGHPAFTGDVTTSAGALATTIANNAVTYAKFQQLAGLSVPGVAGTATANAATLTGTADQVLRVTTAGTALGFGTIATGGIAASAVTYAKIQNVAASSLLGNGTGSPAAPAELTLAGGLAFSGTTLTAAGALIPTSVVSTGAVTSSSATAGVGYATGAGGAVTQATSKSTATPAINKTCGQVTMNAAALAAGTIVSFVLTNSSIAATDLLVLNHVSGGTPGSYSLNGRAAAGSATIDVRNNSAGSLSEAIVIGFAVIKGVTA